MTTSFRIEHAGDAPDTPLVAVALHDGHEVRDEIAAILALDEWDRLREEDPFTAEWTAIAPTRIIARRSRFEVDLNRPRERAVYLEPEQAWGMHVWKSPPDGETLARSLAEYDAFYVAVKDTLSALRRRFPRIVIYDLHSYNHRRGGAEGAPGDPDTHPEVNVGTGTMDRRRWSPVVDGFIEALRAFDFLGRRLDVRENVNFRGGHFSRWVHRTFPDSACVLAIEVKKFFMDEWSGEPFPRELEAIDQALAATVPAVIDALGSVRAVSATGAGLPSRERG